MIIRSDLQLVLLLSVPSCIAAYRKSPPPTHTHIQLSRPLQLVFYEAPVLSFGDCIAAAKQLLALCRQQRSLSADMDPLVFLLGAKGPHD